MEPKTLAELISKGGSNLSVLDAVADYNQQKQNCFPQLKVIQAAVDTLDQDNVLTGVALIMALAKLTAKHAKQGKGLTVDNVLKGARAISGLTASTVAMEAYLLSLAENAN